MTKKLKTIKPLIIGIGLAGRRHLEAQLYLGNKTGIFTTNPQTAKDLGKNKNIIVFDNLDEGIKWANLVHVCTPDDSHTKFIELALKNKKAVLSEKPLTTNLKEALYLQKLAHKHNTPLIVGHNYRLTPTFLETKKRIEKGKLGRITKIETTYLDDMTEYRLENPNRNRQNFLFVGGSHAVDLACWIVNQSVIFVKATVGKKVKSEFASGEKYNITLKFASGIKALIKLDCSTPRATNGTDLIVEGETDQFVSHNKKDQLLFFKKDAKKPTSIKLPNLETLTTPLEIKIVNDYLTGKIDSVLPLPDVDEATETIKILDAVQKSVLLSKGVFVKI